MIRRNYRRPPVGESLRAWHGFQNEAKGGMCVVPMFSQKRAFEDWIFEFDRWFMGFDSWPLGGHWGKIILALRGSPKPKDREDGGGLIERKLCRQIRESYKLEIQGRADFEAVGKKADVCFIKVTLSEIRCVNLIGHNGANQ